MNNSSHLEARFREVLLDGKWVAFTNYKKALEDVDWKQATQQIGSLNTLAMLTFHINYYLAGILPVFDGGGLEIRDKYSFDMDPITSQEEWEKLRASLLSNAEKLAQKISQLTDDQWEKPFVDEKYGSYRRNIEGTIEHCYYHLGQISLIKKMTNISGE